MTAICNEHSKWGRKDRLISITSVKHNVSHIEIKVSELNSTLLYAAMFAALIPWECSHFLVIKYRCYLRKYIFLSILLKKKNFLFFIFIIQSWKIFFFIYFRSLHSISIPHIFIANLLPGILISKLSFYLVICYSSLVLISLSPHSPAF